jgi:DNA-binding LytR/AlgR family response regulator
MHQTQPTAIIADDEPHMRDMMREALALLWPGLDIVAEAEDGIAALAAIDARQPDFAFLDIRMPGMTGLEVAKARRAPTHVVFVTAFDAHAIEAFEVQAVDYLLKPVDNVRLARVVARLRQMTQPAAIDLARLAASLAGLQAGGGAGIAAPAAPRLQWLQVAVGQQVRMVHVDEVQYFESDLKYTRVVAAGVDGIIRFSLKQLGEQLDPAMFVQSHRGTVVNRRFIHAVHRHGETMELELKGADVRLKVSQPNHHLFRAM